MPQKAATNKPASAARESPTGMRYHARRREIIDAAARLFAEQGYEATSFRDIGDAVGLLKGSLYYYAPSKEELLYSIVQEVQQMGRALVEQHSASGLDTVSQLRSLISAGVRFVIENREKNIISMRDFRALGEDRQRQLHDERHVVWNYLCRLIATGKNEGKIRDDVDVVVVATAIIGAINYLPTWYEGGRPPSVSRMVDGYRDCLIEGLLV